MSDNPYSDLFQGGDTGTTTKTSSPPSSSSNPYLDVLKSNTSQPSNLQSTKTANNGFGTNIKVVNLPDFLGGGAYNQGKPGELINTGHGDYAGMTPEKGQERDHIVPVSLGGADTKEDLRYEDLLPKDQQAPGKLTQSDAFLQGVNKEYKADRITLQQARAQVIDYKQKESGILSAPKGSWIKQLFDPATYSKDNIRQAIGLSPEGEPAPKPGDDKSTIEQPSIDDKGNINSLRLKDTPYSTPITKVFGSMFNTTMNVVDQLGNTGNKLLSDISNPISNLIKPGSAPKTSLLQTSADTESSLSSAVQALPSFLAFNAVTKAAADSDVPGISQVGKFVNGAFSFLGNLTSSATEKAINDTPFSDETKSIITKPLSDLMSNLTMLGAMHIGGEVFDKATSQVKDLTSNIASKTKVEAAKGEVTPDTAAKIVNEAVKETPVDAPMKMKVTSANGKEINLDTQQGLVLKNLIKGNEDLTYKRVNSFPKDSNGNQIDARFEWDYKNQKGTILFSKDTSLGALVHEFGHYVDRNLGADIGQKLSDLLPDYEKNKEDINASLAAYVANKITSGFNDKADSDYVKSLQEGKNPSLDKYQTTSESEISPKMLDAGIKDFVDKLHKQVYSLTGGEGSLPATEGENSISTKQEQLDKEWDRLQEAKNNTTDKNAIKRIEKAQKALEEQMRDTQNSIKQPKNKFNIPKYTKYEMPYLFEKPKSEKIRDFGDIENIKSLSKNDIKTIEKNDSKEAKKEGGGYLYHATPGNNIESILKDGLKVNSNKKIFFAYDLSDLNDATFHRGEVVFRIKTDEYGNIPGTKVLVQPDNEEAGLTSRKNIPPENVEVLTKKGWQPIVDKESQNSTGEKEGNTNQLVNEARKDFGEKFATAVRNILINPEASRKISPDLTDYIKHQSQFMGFMSDRLSHTAIDSQFMSQDDSTGTNDKNITVKEKESPSVTQRTDEVLGTSNEATPLNIKKIEDIQSKPGKSITTKAFNEGKINAPDDVIKTMNDIADSNKQFGDVRRKTTLEEQKDFSRRFLGDEKLFKSLPQDMKDNTGKMLAAQQMMTDLASDLTKQLKETDPEDLNGMKDISDKYLRLVATMKAFSGARSAAGQALGALRNDMMAGENSVALADLTSALKEAGLTDKASSIEQTMKAVKKISEPTIVDRFWQLWYANNVMLSPNTYIKHLSGNIVNTLVEMTAGAIRNPNEASGMMSNFLNGWIKGYKQGFGGEGEAPDTVVKEAPVSNKVFFTDKFSKLTEWPGKQLNNLNSIFHYGYSEAEKYGIARDQALEEKKTNPDLDVASRTEEISKTLSKNQEYEAERAGKRGTFTDKVTGSNQRGIIGAMAEVLTKFTSSSNTEKQNLSQAFLSLGGKNVDKVDWDSATKTAVKNIAKLIVPVIRTGANVISAGLDLTPLSLLDPKLVAKTAESIREGELKYDRTQKKQISRAIVGTIALASLASFAGNGGVSGNGPTDPNKKKQLQLQGWQPDSINVNGKWHSYQSLGPIAPLLAIMGNYHDATEYDGMANDTASDRMAAAMSGTVKTISEEGFFTGVQGLLDAASGGGAKWTKYISDEGKYLASTLIPGKGLISSVHTLFDPTKYQTSDIKSYIMNNLAITGGLKPQLNVFGEPVSGSRLSSVAESPEVDDTTKFLGENGLVVNMPNKAMKIDDDNGNKVPITPDQYYQLVQISGPLIKSQIQQSMDSIKSLGDQKEMQKEINSIIKDSREEALSQISK